MKSKIKIKTLADIKVNFCGQYKNICDGKEIYCEEIYVCAIGEERFRLNYRESEEMSDPQIWLLGKDKDTLICLAKKHTNLNKEDILKEIFVAYMIGCGMMVVEH